MDVHRITPAVILSCQFLFFCFLFIIGCIYGTAYVEPDRVQYASYSFTSARLVELKPTLSDGCSNLTDLPCFLQTHINDYFFWTKFVLAYYSLVIIGTIYTWHRTVHFSHCVLAFFVLTDIIFRTDLILYFDRIFVISSLVCCLQVALGSHLEALMPHNIDDPLRALCERIALSDIPDESLRNDHSTRVRFYRWAKKMKKEWNIKEEKLIITAITGTITNIIGFIIITCVLRK